MKGLFGAGPAQGPLSYKIPLFEFAQQLPGDLLGTGMTWVWESAGQGPGWAAYDSGLPDRETLTQLTRENAAIFARESVQSDEEYRRWFVAYGGDGELLDMASNRAEVRKELESFSESRQSRLSALLMQVGDSPYEEFVVSPTATPVLQGLLELWCGRMGTTVDRLDRSPGRTLLRRTLLHTTSLLG